MASIGQNYPNPANDFTVIPVNNPGKGNDNSAF